jgi:hypothetical protein
MNSGCLFAPDRIELATQWNPSHVHSLHAQSHSRSNYENSCGTSFYCVLGCSWVLLGVAGGNDLDFYIVGYPGRAEIPWRRSGRERWKSPDDLIPPKFFKSNHSLLL